MAIHMVCISDDDLHQRIKLRAAVRGQTITAFVSETLRAALALSGPADRELVGGTGGGGKTQTLRAKAARHRDDPRVEPEPAVNTTPAETALAMGDRPRPNVGFRRDYAPITKEKSCK